MLFSLAAGCGSGSIKSDEPVSGHYMKGESAYANKKYSIAKTHFEIVIKSYPTNVNALFKLANIYMRERQWDKALQFYTIILKIKPRFAKAHHNIAMLHLFKAKTHLNYYIANNESFNNKALGKLLDSIDGYSKNIKKKRSPLEKLADVVVSKNN